MMDGQCGCTHPAGERSETAPTQAVERGSAQTPSGQRRVQETGRQTIRAVSSVVAVVASWSLPDGDSVSESWNSNDAAF